MQLVSKHGTDLTVIDLTGNQIGGKLSTLASFGSLTILRLGGMGLSGPSVSETLRLCADGCSTLRTLILSNNALGGCLSTQDREVFGKFTHLSELGLGSVGLTGPPMEEFLEILSPIASTIAKIDLSENALGGVIPTASVSFASFPNLIALELAGNGLLGDEGDSVVRAGVVTLVRNMRTLAFTHQANCPRLNSFRPESRC